MKHVVFVDVAAGDKGAHNMGFLDALCAYAQNSHINFSIVTYYNISEFWKNKLKAKKINIIKLFTVNFYQFSNQRPSISQVSPYIFQLSQEYLWSFKILSSKERHHITHIIFHSMSWEHLQALSLAVQKLENKKFYFHIFLMYWCGIDNENNYQDFFLSSQYKLALTRMSKKNINIKIYTSNKEYQQAYYFLLKNKASIDLHPFFLGDWRGSFLNETKISKDILLYCGEIKQDKGFFDLPNILINLLSIEKFKKCNFILHFTKNNLSTKQKKICKRLQDIATEFDVRIDFINQFIDTQNLIFLYQKCALVVLCYHLSRYCQKTSGMLWLSVQCNVACMVTKGTWLQRELDNFRLDYYMICGNNISYVSHDGNLSVQDFKYRQKIFQPFGDWLENL